MPLSYHQSITICDFYKVKCNPMALCSVCMFSWSGCVKCLNLEVSCFDECRSTVQHSERQKCGHNTLIIHSWNGRLCNTKKCSTIFTLPSLICQYKSQCSIVFEIKIFAIQWSIWSCVRPFVSVNCARLT